MPRRPQEASGTSGEKVAINGGLNFSILDGWWLEGYDGTNGFAIGNGSDSAEVAKIDALDAESLYRTLELEVVPLYYHRDEAGLPRKWIAMMKRAAWPSRLNRRNHSALFLTSGGSTLIATRSPSRMWRAR